MTNIIINIMIKHVNQLTNHYPLFLRDLARNGSSLRTWSRGRGSHFPFSVIFAQASRRVTVRLKTGAFSEESPESTQK